MTLQLSRMYRPITATAVAGVTTAMVLATTGGTVQASPRTWASSSSTVRTAAASALSTSQASYTSKVIGQVFASDGTTVVKRVRGTFTPASSFVGPGGKMFIRGTLRLRIIDAASGNVQKVTRYTSRMPVRRIDGQSVGPVARQGAAAAPAPCPVLNLVLGPLDLDLLGLQVHLSTVILNILAQPGPGKLLGNLLCAVAGLLDSTPVSGALSNLLTQVSGLLNSILAILRA
jgi:hypothetical protein